MFCKFKNCNKIGIYRIQTEIDSIIYYITCCDEHKEWAQKELEKMYAEMDINKRSNTKA